MGHLSPAKGRLLKTAFITATFAAFIFAAGTFGVLPLLTCKYLLVASFIISGIQLSSDIYKCLLEREYLKNPQDDLPESYEDRIYAMCYLDN